MWEILKSSGISNHPSQCPAPHSGCKAPACIDECHAGDPCLVSAGQSTTIGGDARSWNVTLPSLATAAWNTAPPYPKSLDIFSDQCVVSLAGPAGYLMYQVYCDEGKGLACVDEPPIWLKGVTLIISDQTPITDGVVLINSKFDSSTETYTVHFTAAAGSRVHIPMPGNGLVPAKLVQIGSNAGPMGLCWVDFERYPAAAGGVPVSHTYACRFLILLLYRYCLYMQRLAAGHMHPHMMQASVAAAPF